VTGVRCAVYNTWWWARDFIYMQCGSTQCEPAQHTTHIIANWTRLGISTHKCYRHSWGSNGLNDHNPSVRSQGGGGISRSDKNEGGSSCGNKSNVNVRLWPQYGGNTGGYKVSGWKPMGNRNDNYDEPWSSHWRSCIFKRRCHSSRLH